MSQPSTPLSPTDQDALVKQIGLALMRAAPEDWHQIKTVFSATGRYYEMTADVLTSDGTEGPWTAPQDVTAHFAKLRSGMYREGRGTWFNARYQIERPSSYNLEFDRLEPQWRTPPPVAAYRDELHVFPRTEDNVPEWLIRRLSGLPADRSDRRFRMARIFDGNTPNGRPAVNRPPVSDDDREQLLDYLEQAAVAIAGQGHDVDRMSQDSRQTVPVTVHTDGTWVWPAAVGYYLRRYGVPPDPELVNHARSRGFRRVDVDEATKAAAATAVANARPAALARPLPSPEPRPVPPSPPVNSPPSPAPRPTTKTPPGPPPGPAANSPGGPPPGPANGLPKPTAGKAPEPAASAAKTTALPVQPPPRPTPRPAAGQPQRGINPATVPTDVAVPVAPPANRGLDALRRRLTELGVVDTAYRIGTPAPRTWCIEQVGDGWEVGWHDADGGSPMLFDDVDDATAFLLGKLLLVGPGGPPRPAPSGASGKSGPTNGSGQPAGGSTDAPTKVAEPVKAPPAEWPIQPLRGEPPLSLFKGKQLIELPPGTEIDRFGSPDGNLTYEVGTPFAQRSLVPEWKTRPYHVYQVRRPLRALSGRAIPWFDQPGGGVGYLLPQAIEELLNGGDLVEVEATALPD